MWAGWPLRKTNGESDNLLNRAVAGNHYGFSGGRFPRLDALDAGAAADYECALNIVLANRLTS
jgi:hypothetical protein